ncbi:MAG TPA: META domain-containing protein [Thiopseudomonas sp.]|nr:META domain-containing protein [Thiopseudomonas sp.]
MHKFILFLSSSALLAACANLPSTQLPQSQTYQVEWIAERPLIDRSMLTFTLLDSQRAAGLAGCNHWAADYQLTGKHLRLYNITSTRKLCAPALMEQEQRLLNALAHIQHWKFAEHGQLWLSAQQSAPIKLWPIDTLTE